MFPFIPHSVIQEHNREDRARQALRHRGPIAHDPDDFLGTYDDLPPDPGYLAFRGLLTTGPVGALWARLDRWIEARENRRDARSITDSPEAAAPGAAVESVHDVEHPVAAWP